MCTGLLVDASHVAVAVAVAVAHWCCKLLLHIAVALQSTAFTLGRARTPSLPSLPSPPSRTPSQPLPAVTRWLVNFLPLLICAAFPVQWR